MLASATLQYKDSRDYYSLVIAQFKSKAVKYTVKGKEVQVTT
jgi:hypothetical protein